jgi:CDP-glycerol glycerophosphotransferase (TagB/SpsB family)
MTSFESFTEFTISNYLKDIIYELLNETSYNVILRPHPSNRDHIKIHELIEIFKHNTKFQCDFSENYVDTYAKSQILITDMSGTAYTFAFLTLCPVIFFLPNDDAIKKNNYDKLNFFLIAFIIFINFFNKSKFEISFRLIFIYFLMKYCRY